MPARSGRHFLQIPGPTNVPDRVLRAIDRATIDHRGADFFALAKDTIAGMKRIFRTSGPVAIYGASGTGAWGEETRLPGPAPRVPAGDFPTAPRPTTCYCRPGPTRRPRRRRNRPVPSPYR